ncbi:MAG: RPA12/RPB9/RPC11 RNA polymerase family protein [Haloferacaceae archaeon]
MEFCDECGAMMKKDGDVWRCKNGHEKRRENGGSDAVWTTQEREEDSGPVDLSDVDPADMNPTTNATCPQCGNDRAHYTMKQIRSADESETRFFVCTECEHRWREDDH